MGLMPPALKRITLDDVELTAFVKNLVMTPKKIMARKHDFGWYSIMDPAGVRVTYGCPDCSGLGYVESEIVGPTWTDEAMIGMDHLPCTRCTANGVMAVVIFDHELTRLTVLRRDLANHVIEQMTALSEYLSTITRMELEKYLEYHYPTLTDGLNA
jgi:hypothetical protein